MKKIVISQPMFFPWVGLFEQIKLADTYIHYDDVQLPLGRSFITRVQVKTYDGIKWLSVPIKRNGKQLINNVVIDSSQDWRKKHLNILKHNYSKTPFFKEMFDLVNNIYKLDIDNLSVLNILTIEKIANYFDIDTQFQQSSYLQIEAQSSMKLLEIVKNFNGDIYITGHGASNYLDHQLFEKEGIRVEYMNYQKLHYDQLYGNFTPYVSVLDLIANLGKEGIKYINSSTLYWKDFMNSQKDIKQEE
ncbi:WbqC family protein [Geminocystis sp. NIES-3709]|uniref:WbqC family protein n=1 Tax=Geminocystis sp. NIES-3709 TaxID=1617448 RepID=UPI0005FC4B27|nr:WbqC family protein [Geminocystis sp. NIES-3709]BAQ65657.1 hypothetical protein GM3709_2422 [Geminocystis sp. NIES-3709]